MPGQEFDENVFQVFPAVQDSTFNASTVMDLSGNLNAPRRYDQLLLGNSDTVSHTFTLNIYDGSANTAVFDVAVPAGSGHGSLAPVDAILQIRGSTYPYLRIPGQYAVHGKWDSAPASGKFLSWLLLGGVM